MEKTNWEFLLNLLQFSDIAILPMALNLWFYIRRLKQDKLKLVDYDSEDIIYNIFLAIPFVSYGIMAMMNTTTRDEYIFTFFVYTFLMVPSLVLIHNKDKVKSHLLGILFAVLITLYFLNSGCWCNKIGTLALMLSLTILLVFLAIQIIIYIIATKIKKKKLDHSSLGRMVAGNFVLYVLLVFPLQVTFVVNNTSKVFWG